MYLYVYLIRFLLLYELWWFSKKYKLFFILYISNLDKFINSTDFEYFNLIKKKIYVRQSDNFYSFFESLNTKLKFFFDWKCTLKSSASQYNPLWILKKNFIFCTHPICMFTCILSLSKYAIPSIWVVYLSSAKCKFIKIIYWHRNINMKKS